MNKLMLYVHDINSIAETILGECYCKYINEVDIIHENFLDKELLSLNNKQSFSNIKDCLIRAKELFNLHLGNIPKEYYNITELLNVIESINSNDLIIAFINNNIKDKSELRYISDEYDMLKERVIDDLNSVIDKLDKEDNIFVDSFFDSFNNLSSDIQDFIETSNDSDLVNKMRAYRKEILSNDTKDNSIPVNELLVRIFTLLQRLITIVLSKYILNIYQTHN